MTLETRELSGRPSTRTLFGWPAPLARPESSNGLDDTEPVLEPNADGQVIRLMRVIVTVSRFVRPLAVRPGSPTKPVTVCVATGSRPVTV